MIKIQFVVFSLFILIFPFPGKAEEIWKEPITGMKFVRVDVEQKQNKILPKIFWIGQYEVTNKQYRQYKPNHNSGFYRKKSLNKDNQPVVKVNWEEANAFAKWLTRKHKKRYKFRLPTELEWQYACRAGTFTTRFWGDNPNHACQYANVYDQKSTEINRFPWQHHQCNDGYPVTAPVGSFAPNRLGLYDMIGNVWEWCEDMYRKGSPVLGEAENPLYYGTESRVSRGGGWSDDPTGVCCTFRDGFSTLFRSGYLGFRLVKEP